MRADAKPAVLRYHVPRRTLLLLSQRYLRRLDCLAGSSSSATPRSRLNCSKQARVRGTAHIHNMRVGEASDVVRRAVRRGGGVRSPESAPTSDVRDV